MTSGLAAISAGRTTWERKASLQAPGITIVAPPAELPGWARRAINLADPRLGAEALFASDDFFAPVGRMLNPAPAIFIVGKYDENGKWMDGWESRRKRDPGNDWAIVKLGVKGVIYGFDIDTSHFNGNQPLAVSIDACRSTSDVVDQLNESHWTEILPRTPLEPNAHHLLPIANSDAWTHLRLQIYPDGGVARLRAYGRAIGPFDEIGSDTVVDLVAMQNGGTAVSWNDASFGSSVSNLILPGPGVNMGDGWETRRRRESGHDWCLFALGAPGTIERIDVDTSFYKGNYPDRCSLQAALMTQGTIESLAAQSASWPVLLPEQKLQMDTLQSFTEQVVDLGPVTHARLNIFPDGGVSRLRLWGRKAD